jgi:hypothetical protein
MPQNIKIPIPEEFSLKIGVFYSGLANIAAKNVYGTQYIPKRDFFADAKDKLIETLKEKTIQYVHSVNQKRTDRSLVDEIGILGVDILKESIINFSFPPNAPSTIKKKGFNDPLVWTGKLTNSITYVKK